MPAKLCEEVRRLAKRLRRTQSEVLQECIRAGLPQLRRQAQPNGDYLHPPVMTRNQAQRLFRPDPEWDKVESTVVKQSLKALKPDAD